MSKRIGRDDKYSVREAKAHFSAVCDAAHNGETIVITKNGEPWADVIPHTPQKKVYRTFEPLEGVSGSITVSMDEFLAPMAEEELALWEGESENERDA